jgi:hypothetical protein
MEMEMEDKTFSGKFNNKPQIATKLRQFIDNIKSRGPIPVDPVRFLGPHGAKLRLFDRKSSLLLISETFKSYLGSYRDRESCRIAVIASAPGLGKTKLLLALPELFKNDAHVIVVSYNNGNALTDFDKSNPSSALALRALYFGFVNINDFPSFGKFLDHVRMQGLPLDQLRIDHLVQNTPMILAIDEFNYLVDGDKNPLLKDMIQQLTSAMQIVKGPGFFPVMAGTTMQPLVNVLNELVCKWTVIPLTFIKTKDVDELIQSQTWIKDWQGCKVFRHCLSLMGGLPRLLFYFLEECRKFKDFPINQWNFRQIIEGVLQSSSYLTESLPVAPQLLIDAYLQSTIGHMAALRVMEVCFSLHMVMSLGWSFHCF